MAGNRQAYEAYMEAGHNAAWDQDWPVAIKAYTQAVREFTEDPEAHIHLGLALLRANRLEEALKIYNRAHGLAPDDPVPLEKSADILERMGRLKEAAQAYVRVSDVYLSQRDLDKAIGNWERATQLTPGLITIHAKLAQAYERVGDKRKAVRQYLTLAFNFRREGDTDKAVKSVERALRLDRNNPQALNIMSALKSGADINPLAEEAPAEKPKPRLDDDFDFSARDDRVPVGESDPLGPMGEAMTTSMGALAEYVIESGSMDAYGAGALQALEFQRQERMTDAIRAYKTAEPAMRHPALKMNLGGLLVLQNEFAEAIKHLGEAATSPSLNSGALHGLGIAYYRLNKQKQASRFLLESLQAVDSSLVMDEGEEAELRSVYQRLFTVLEDMSEERLSASNEKFIRLLSGKDWKQRVAETRRQIYELLNSGEEAIITDFITDSGADDLTESVARIDRFTRQGLLLLAMDEAHRAVERSPFYLPIHVRMAEIMMREGRVRNAITKYNTVAKAYMVRGEVERAASILTEVLELAPLDVSIRNSLIELLESEKRYEDVLEHYIDLAHTYHQLGDFEKARDTLTLSERLSRRIEAPVAKMIAIKHGIAELDQMRLDMRRAQQAYEEIVRLAPDDERAHRHLVDIYFNQGNPVEATRRLDQLLGIYAKKKQVSRIVQTLEELVKIYPKDSGLRSRMAGIYRQLGRSGEAIEQLDALGELQLEAGNHRDAVNTIKLIIKLKPSNVDDYRRLLSQLGG